MLVPDSNIQDHTNGSQRLLNKTLDWMDTLQSLSLTTPDRTEQSNAQNVS